MKCICILFYFGFVCIDYIIISVTINGVNMREVSHRMYC